MWDFRGLRHWQRVTEERLRAPRRATVEERLADGARHNKELSDSLAQIKRRARSAAEKELRPQDP